MSHSNSKQPGESRFWTVDFIAVRWCCSEKHVRRLIKTGELPHHRLGRNVRVSSDDLLRYEAGQRHS